MRTGQGFSITRKSVLEHQRRRKVRGAIIGRAFQKSMISPIAGIFQAVKQQSSYNFLRFAV
jgi:hypothetical protein